MNELFKVILSLSFSASLLILALLWCRPLFKKRFSKRWQYYIWLVVIARLLLPFTPQVSLMGRLFQQGAPAVVQAPAGFHAEKLAGFTEPEAISDAAPTPFEGGSQQAPVPLDAAAPVKKIGETLRQNLWMAWIGVVLALLVRKITVYQSFVQQVKAGCTEAADTTLLDWLAQAGEEMRIKRPVELYINSMVSSPLLLGFFRPCVILPSAGLPEVDLWYTVRHELTHYRRRDMFYKWLVQAAVCLHWFNPLCWLMAREIGRACELACDEAVIQGLDLQQRRAYGDTLFRAMEAGGGYKSPLVSVALNESAELLKERLDAIMKFKKGSRWMGALSLIVAAIGMAGALAAGAYALPAERSTDPLTAIKGEEETGFRYTQEGYYQEPYLFEIGWNVRENNRYTSTTFTVWDKAEQADHPLAIYFVPECEGIQNDAYALQALQTRLTQLYFETRETDDPATRFLVVDVQHTGDTDPGELAQQYYANGSLPQFEAVFAALDAQKQKEWLERIYDEGRTAFFSISLNRLERDSRMELVKQFAERAYSDGTIALFSVLTGYMEPQTLESWLARATQDNRMGFQSMLLEKTGGKQELEEKKEELERQLREEYRLYGITKSGGSYHYQGQPVRIFLDIREDSSFQTLEINPQGTVDIQVTRKPDGSIQKVGPMAAEQAQALLEDMQDPDEGWEDAGWPDPGKHRQSQGTAPAIDTLEFRGTTYYLVTDEAQLRAIATGAYGLDKDYMQQTDIRLSSSEWVPIGTRENPFTGSYNGNGFEIKGLTMADPDAKPAGLFGAAKDAYIYNITLRDYDIEGAGGDLPESSAAPVVALVLDGTRTHDLFAYPSRPQQLLQEDGQDLEEFIRLEQEELPRAVRAVQAGCTVRTWYVIRCGGRQYLWYDGIGDFAYQPTRQGEGWQLDILPAKKQGSGYLLLSLPLGGQLQINLDGEPVSYTVLEADA